MKLSIQMNRPTNKQEAEIFLRNHDYDKSLRSNAKKHGIPYTTYQNWFHKAEQLMEGYDLPIGHGLKGVSKLIDGEGNTKLEWVKTDRTQQDIEDGIQAFVDGLKDQIPRAQPVKSPNYTIKELLSCYVLTDYHFGQLSWKDEAGEDWDCEIAENLLVKWFESAIATAPKSHTAVLAQLGDFLHWDGLEAVTPTSRHLLDADSRFPRVVEMATRVLRRVIEMLLMHHRHVHIIMAEGNHDIASSIWLRTLFEQFYEDEPRVTVDTTPVPYYSYEWGSTALYFHHGHKKNLKTLSSVFVSRDPELYGRTKYWYGHTGHLHHVDIKEDNLMILEQHPTLAAKDAHSARGGYASKRGATVITYSSKAGEIARSTIRPEVLQ
jgi:hypothetical protein